MKKAMALGKLMAGVLMLAGLLILVLFVAKARYSTSQIVEDSECSQNIIAYSTLLRASGEANIADVYCPTKYYTFKGNAEAEVKKELADSLKTCWGTWGRGELLLFKKDNVYCHICSVSSFENKNTRVNDFGTYLATEHVPGSKFADMTYVQYLKYFSTDTPGDEVRRVIAGASGAASIETSKQYASLFIYAKGKNTIRDFLKDSSLGTGSTAVGGAATGAKIGAVVGGGVIVVSGLATGGVSWVVLGVGAAIATVGTFAGGILGFVEGNAVDYMAITVLAEYAPESLDAVGCKAAPVLQNKEKARLG